MLAVDRATGDIMWERQIGSPAIGSPVVVDGMLIQGDCTGASVRLGRVATRTRSRRCCGTCDLGDCIESTPAVWHGWLYVGTREGYLYGIADANTPPPTAT